MISSTILNIGYFLLATTVALFPLSSGYPEAVREAFEYIGGFLDMLSPIVPIDTLVFTTGTIFAVELLILTFKLVEWIYRKLPFVGK